MSVDINDLFPDAYIAVQLSADVTKSLVARLTETGKYQSGERPMDFMNRTYRDVILSSQRTDGELSPYIILPDGTGAFTVPPGLELLARNSSDLGLYTPTRFDPNGDLNGERCMKIRVLWITPNI